MRPAAQTTTTVAATTIANDTRTCHSGGPGWIAMRSSIRKGADVGSIDSTTDSVLSGARMTADHVTSGRMTRIITGVIMLCVSLRSLHAAPIATKIDPKIRTAMIKKAANHSSISTVIELP